MESLEILKEATAAFIAKRLGTLIFISSGLGIIVNYHLPGVIPGNVTNGMYYYLTFGFGGMAYFSVKSQKNPHLSSEICPKCNSRVKYTGIKCLSKDCDYEVRFQNN